MLRARGIPYRQTRGPTGHGLEVPEDSADEAMRELRAYEEENRDWPPKDVPVRMAGGGLEGAAAYVAILVAVYLLDAARAFGASWKGVGSLKSDRLFSEPWRLLTALTLHSDPPHLISNLLFGSLFGYLVCLSLGGGVGWLAILVAAGCGNFLNGLVRGPASSSLGASTAVFAAVGLLAGCEWRRRVLLKQRRIRRAAPFVMASLILGYWGMGSGNTDVAAHVAGLVAGIVVAVPIAGVNFVFLVQRRIQWAATLTAWILLSLAWYLALR